MFCSRVRLVQTNTFHAEGQSKIVERVISELQRGAFKDEEIWDNVPISIPSLPPSGLSHCSIINIEYRIEVQITQSGTTILIRLRTRLKNGNAIMFPFFTLIFHKGVSYLYFKFHVNPGTCSMDFFIPLNIIIGNVALHCSLKTDMTGSVSPSPDVTAEVSDLRKL